MRSLSVASLALVASLAACGLNPQPEPPNDTPEVTVNGSSGASGATSMGGSGSDTTKAGAGGTAATPSQTGGAAGFPNGGGQGGSGAAGAHAGGTSAGGSSSGSGGASGNGNNAGGSSGGVGFGGATGGTGGVSPSGGFGGTSGVGGSSGSSIGGSSGSSGACGAVTPAQDVDPWSVRAPSAGFGGITMDTSSGHQDVYLESPAAAGLPAGYIRIGARLDWGGSVVFFGLADPNSNVIDANDTGRELQIALYDPDRAMQGCAATATCATMPSTCPNSISYLGWDPVQGGDRCGHGATVSSQGQDGDALKLVVQPLQWNPDWDAPDCTQTTCGAAGVPASVTYTFEMRFVHPNVVEIATEVASQESFDHGATSQEFPTLYVAHGQNGPDLPLLFDASGTQPAIDTPGNDGFYYGNFASPAPWVSFQDAASDYGVALAMDQGITAFQGWRGDGVTAPYFHNVRAQIAFGLPAGGTVRGISYLALGSFATVGSLVPSILAARPAFGHVDAPAYPTGTSQGTQLHVSGWVLDTTHVGSVDVRVDGISAGAIQVATARPDVCAVYPAYDGCPGVGFDGTVNVPALADGCQHLVQVVATDSDGNATVLGERAVSAGP